MRSYRFGWHGDNGVGEFLIQAILSGRKTATVCPSYDPVEAETGETLRLVDKNGKPRGTIQITRQDHRPFSAIDETLAAALGMTLEEIQQAARYANSRPLSPEEEMRVTYFKLIAKQ